MINRIYILNINEYCKDSLLTEKFELWLTDEKREKIHRYINKRDYMRSLLADVLVRVILSRILGKSPEKIEFWYNEYGKPYVKGRGGIFFNVSHSEDYVVSVVSEYECGIDIEKKHNMDMSFAESIFTAKEHEYLKGFASRDFNTMFYKIWTLKEAYVKYMGKGLSLPFDGFSFVNEENEFPTHAFDKSIRFSQIDIKGDYIISVCGKYEFKNITNIDLKTF